MGYFLSQLLKKGLHRVDNTTNFCCPIRRACASAAKVEVDNQREVALDSKQKRTSASPSVLLMMRVVLVMIIVTVTVAVSLPRVPQADKCRTIVVSLARCNERQLAMRRAPPEVLPLPYKRQRRTWTLLYDLVSLTCFHRLASGS